MAVDRVLSTPAVSSPDAATRGRLSEALTPGARRLTASGAMTAAAAAATAAGFFAVAAVAQDVLEGHASWARDAAWLLLLAGAAAVRAGAGYLAAQLAVDGALAVERRLRSALLGRLLDGAGSWLGSAAQATAVMDEVERVGTYAERYQPARVAATLVPLVLLAAVFPFSWLVGVLLVLCAPLPPLNLSIVGMGTAAVARRHGEELRHLSGYFLDRLRGLATLRALGAERAELARVSAASQRLTESSMAVLRVAFISAAVLEAIVTVAVAVVAMYVGLTLLGYVNVPGLPSEMSLRTGLFLLMVTPLYFQPVRALAAAYHERADALAAIDALQPLLAAAPASPRRAAGRALVSPPSVEVADLRVAFAGRELPALDDVSLAIEPGELIGVTGASGPASRRCCECSRAISNPRAAVCSSTGCRPRTSGAPRSPGSASARISSPARWRRTSRWAGRRRMSSRSSTRRSRPAWGTCSTVFPAAWRRRSASAAGGSRAARRIGWRSRARSSSTRRCCSSTSRPLTSTPPARARSSRSSVGSPRPRRRSWPATRRRCSPAAIA